MSKNKPIFFLLLFCLIVLPDTDCNLQALGLIVYVELQAQHVPIELQGVFLSALYVKDCAKHPTQEDSAVRNKQK